MEEQRPDTERKRDGFRGERMIVLPTEAFSDYVRLRWCGGLSDRCGLFSECGPSLPGAERGD